MQSEANIIYRPDWAKYDELSLGHMIMNNLMKLGDATVWICGLTGRKLTAIDLVAGSVEISKALTAAGIKTGDVVSIISENRFEFAFVMFGAIFLNCTLAPLNYEYSERELKHGFNLSKPKIVFVSASGRKAVMKVVKSLSYVEKVILLDDLDEATNLFTINLKGFTNPKTLQNVKFELKRVDTLTTSCLIMCSSGTTGLPKGVQLSQSNLIVTARQSAESFLSKSSLGDAETVILCVLPLFHAFAATLLICSMATGDGKIVFLPKFERKMFVSSIEKFRCTVAVLVPPLMVFLAKNKLVDDYDLSSLRFIRCGAAPLSKELLQAVKNRLKNPKLVIKQLYGMTEFTVGILTEKDVMKPGSVGDVNAGAYAKVIDEQGKALGPNLKGELCFKGSVVMMGYIGDEQATRATIDEDGWLHTGDIGYYDEDLQFFIVDRIKELIKWKGFQVPPAEIEALLLAHAMIKDCGVVGRPDEFAGELPLAFIVRKDPNLSEHEVIKYVSDNASPANRLHGGVVFVDEIPKNPSGKILRRKLRTMLNCELKSKL